MQILENVPLRDRTTIRIGGPARHYVAPASAAEAAEAAAWARAHGIPLYVLGRGSNAVISDAGLPGLVLDISERLTGITFDGARVRCRGGALLHTLVRESVGRGLAGIEQLAGIPGTVGGAVVMNAGAFGQEIGATVVEVVSLDPATGATARLSAAELRFGYRHSVFMERAGVVLEVTCQLRPGDPDTLARAVEETLARRREKQPLDLPNCGSVFRNPPGQGAGRHIEAAGLKGRRVGGIQVSPRHANFFVNLGGGTAEDFRRLTREVQQTVHERTGILLQPEVEFLGAFSAPLYDPKGKTCQA